MRFLPNDCFKQGTNTKDSYKSDRSHRGKRWYPSIQAKAARLCFGLVKNHAMIDGNKRLGTHVMLVFLALNGYELFYSQKELIDIILALASGDIGEKEMLQWIMAHQK